MDMILQSQGPSESPSASGEVVSIESASASSAQETDLVSGGRRIDLPPPYRQVGGAPVEGVFEALIDKGLPATCPVHGVWLFEWRGSVGAFFCPRDRYGDRCGSHVRYEDVISSADGGVVRGEGGWLPRSGHETSRVGN
jgi:hypothetical protein